MSTKVMSWFVNFRTQKRTANTPKNQRVMYARILLRGSFAVDAHTPFGWNTSTLDPFVRAFTPTRWASQCLGLNLVTALATHLTTSLSKIDAAQSQSLTRSRVIGFSFRTSRPSPILDPCPGFLAVGAPVFT